MPNWCNNHAVVYHNNPEMLSKLVNSCNNETLFNTFVPRPETEDDNWYNWNIRNWGTKWEASHWDETFVNTEGKVVLGFNTAWAPPIEFYNSLVEQGFEVKAYYFEPGMNFCGQYEDGSDEYVEIEGGSEWVKEFVPEEVNEVFGISDMFEDMEEESGENV